MKTERKLSYLLMGGHLMSDTAQGALSAATAFLVLNYGFSYAQAAGLIFAANLTTAIVQPLFGVLGDKKPRPWFMCVGIVLAGAGVAGIGLTSSYPLIIALSVISGFGVDMFHPEGGRLSNLVAGRNKSAGMSIFSIGGNLGFAAGPLLMSLFVGCFGMPGMVLFIFPALVYALVLLKYNNVFAAYGNGESTTLPVQERDTATDASDRPAPFALVVLLQSFRSIISYALTSFTTLYMVNALGCSTGMGSVILTCVSLAGAVGTLCSGRAAGHLGQLRLALACSVGLTLLSLLLSGTPMALVAAPSIVCMGFLLTLSNPSTVAYGQELLPHHLGLASGMLLGVAVCAGGVGTPLMGGVADSFGAPSIFAACAAVSVVSACIVLALNVLEVRTQRSPRDMRAVTRP